MGKDAGTKRIKNGQAERQAPNKGQAGKKFNAADERDKRLTQAALNSALAVKVCEFCSTVGAWKIYNIERNKGRIRYIKCKACGHNACLPLIETDRLNTG